MTRPSRDRVHFQLPSVSDVYATRRVACRAFGLTPREYDDAVLHRKTIICRPSQFARFIVWRNEEGLNNSVKILNAKLVPSPCEDELDVAGRAYKPSED